MTQKDFWINAYLAALHRVDHAAASEEANAALACCNKRWHWARATPVKVQMHLHECPIGFDGSADDNFA